MKFKPEELQNIPIIRAAAEGNCVAQTDKGVVFVKYAAPGDVADLKIYKKEKKALFAKIEKLKQASADRLDPFCEHFEICGGCKWQHTSYDAQLSYKALQVKDNFQRIGKFPFPEPMPIVGSDNTTAYRNKMDFGFSAQRFLLQEEMNDPSIIRNEGLGFHVPGRFDKILDIKKCWLQDDLMNQIRLETRRFTLENEMSYYDLRNHTGLMRSLIIRNSTLGEWMVILAVTEMNKKVKALMDQLVKTFPQISSLMYVVNTKLNDTIYDLEVIPYHGKDHLLEKLGDLTFRVRPKSFFQTNTKQAEKLYEITRNFAGLSGNENVYDLYTGTGSIALYVASRAKHVAGIEYVQQAIDDAIENAAFNNINNVSFYAGDMKDVLNDEFIMKEGKADVIISDPPRAGMHPDVVKKLLEIKAPKIVYVSCNPATQARDLAALVELYSVEKVQPVDMFPHTHHVENVVELRLREG